MTAFRSMPVICVAFFIAMIAMGFLLPDWAKFLMTMAFAKGLVALGIIGLMRSGLVSFGQGLYFCVGAYVSGLMANWTGVTDIFLLSILGVLATVAIGVVFGHLLAKYRGIFFAMLSLSLSMVLYGSLSKLSVLGGTDGLNVTTPTFFGYLPASEDRNFALYAYTCGVVVLAGGMMRVFFDSQRGLINLGIRDNELRIEYLGFSVRSAIANSYLIAAVLGGLGGVISGLAIGHVDPEYAYWTTSGEFVFVAILSGHFSISAVFASSILLELVRSFSNLYFPNTWQMALGIFLVVVILLLPNGLGSLLSRFKFKKAN